MMRLRRILKVLLVFLISIIGLILLLSATANLPFAHRFITNKVNSFLSDSDIPIHIGSVKKIALSSFYVQGVILEDLEGDTIFYGGDIRTSFIPTALFRKRLILTSVFLGNARMRLLRGNKERQLNIIEAFSIGTSDTSHKSGDVKIPWEVFVGKTELSKIKFQMHDSVSGIHIDQYVSNIKAKIDKMSLPEETILIQSLEIEGVTGSIKMDPSVEETTSSDSSLWKIGLADLSLKDINVTYDDTGEKRRMSLLLGDLTIKKFKTDLKNKEINFKKVSASNTSIKIHSDDHLSEPEPTGLDNPIPFRWAIKGEDFDLVNVSFNLSDHNDTLNYSSTSGFSIKNLDMNLSDIQYNKDIVNLELKKLRFDLSNGFSLKEMKGKLDSHSGTTRLNLSFETGNSLFDLACSAESGLTDILNKPDKIKKAKATIKNTRISIRDLFCFKQDLKEKPVFSILAREPIELAGNIDLETSTLTFSDISINQNKFFVVTLDGKIQNSFRPEKLKGEVQFGIPDINVARMEDLAKETGLDIHFPDLKNLSIKGTLSDSLKSPDFDISIRSDLGRIDMLGSIDLRDSSFSAKSFFNNLKVGNISGNQGFGSFNGSIEINGSGFTRKSIAADIIFLVDSLYFNGYNYTKTSVDCKLRQEQFDISLLIDDPFLKSNLKALMSFNDSTLDLKAKGDFLADLHKLHLFKDTLSIEGELSGNFHKEKNVIGTGITVSGIKLSTPEDVLKISQIDLSFKADSAKSSLSGKADFFNILVSVEKPVEELNAVFLGYQKYLQSFTDRHLPDSPERVSFLPEMNARVKISYNKALGILIRDTSLHFTDLDLSLNNRTADKRVDCSIKGSAIRYKMVGMGNLNASLVDTARILNLRINADDCSVFSHPMSKIILTSRFADLKGVTRASILGARDEVEYDLELSESVDSNNIIIMIPSKQITMNEVKWMMESPQLITYNRTARTFSPALKIHTNNSFINIITDENEGVHNYKCELGNVTFSSVIRDDMVQGKPEGSVSGSMEFGIKGDQGKIITTDLQFGDVSWSDLNFNGIILNGYFLSDSPGDYSFDLTAQLDSAKIVIKGKKPLKGNRTINAGFKLIPIKIVQPFVKKFLSDLEGFVSGDFNISTKDEIENINGDLIIDDGNLRINTLNSVYRMPDERIKFTGKKMVFDNFIVLDSLNNELSVNGTVDFSNRNSVSADLVIISSNLQIMNKREEKNSAFYGNIFIDSRLAVKGPVASPVLKGKIVLAGGTEIFFRQMENLNLSESEKILTFVSNNTSAEQHNLKPEPGQNIYNKTSVESVVEIDPATRIHINLSKKMFNIELVIKGGGELNYNMLVNSQVNLAGKYEVNEGSADLKMIGWPNKAFSITGGGFIRWDGKLEDPELQFEAVNRVRSSYINPVDNKERYVDFDVTLKLSNRLSALDVLFKISTSDQYLMSIINTMSPEEQMRQAITILLFEKIDLPGISTSSNYVTEQVNQMIATQLNQLTKTTIKGIDISFGIDSYVQATESGGQQTKTSLSYQLKRTLLNNRAQIELSGRLNDVNKQPNSSDLSLNNFSFEYRLDSAATKFLKVYNEHSYEDVFEGEIVKTGIGFTYRKSYPSLGDIWRRDEEKKRRRD